MRITDLIEEASIDAELIGCDLNVKTVASLDTVSEKQLTFCKDTSAYTIQSHGCVIVIDNKYHLPPGNTYVLVKDTKLSFIRMMKVLYPKYIKPTVTIGQNVEIHPSSVIGSDGLGHVRNEKGEWEVFPHIKGVQIEDNVEILAANTINRGSLRDTIIGAGTKIGNQNHVAHNVIVGKHCLLTALISVAGSSIIGDYTEINPGVNIASSVKTGIN